MAEPVVPTTVALTNQERRVIYSALMLSSSMMDALGDASGATTALELAYRVLPGGLRCSEDAS